MPYVPTKTIPSAVVRNCHSFLCECGGDEIKTCHIITSTFYLVSVKVKKCSFASIQTLSTKEGLSPKGRRGKGKHMKQQVGFEPGPPGFIVQRFNHLGTSQRHIFGQCPSLSCVPDQTWPLHVHIRMEVHVHACVWGACYSYTLVRIIYEAAQPRVDCAKQRIFN